MGRSVRDAIDAGFARARDLCASVDAGAAPGCWIEGALSFHACLSGVRERATAIADAVDPGQQISRSRLPD
jgi:hypothetical protein